MNKKQKDEICAMWVKVFGTQEGVGMNCPAGAYKFAEMIIKKTKDDDREMFCGILRQMHDSISLQSDSSGFKKRTS